LNSRNLRSGFELPVRFAAFRGALGEGFHVCEPDIAGVRAPSRIRCLFSPKPGPTVRLARWDTALSNLSSARCSGQSIGMSLCPCRYWRGGPLTATARRSHCLKASPPIPVHTEGCRHTGSRVVRPLPGWPAAPAFPFRPALRGHAGGR